MTDANPPGEGKGSNSAEKVFANVQGIEARETPDRGVATFATRPLQPGDVVLFEEAMFVSTVGLSESNREIWDALSALQKSRKVADFNPGQHLGALVALRELGAKECRNRVLKLCGGQDTGFVSPRSSKREAAVLKSLVADKVLPQNASISADDYARLRRVVRKNGFVYTHGAAKDDVVSGVGEAVFENISRVNHSCCPNLRFDLQWDDATNRLTNQLTAIAEITTREELFISYHPEEPGKSQAERRAVLKKHFEFDCMCSRCEDLGPPATEPRPDMIPEALI